MTKTRGGKWNRRFCKWIASLLTTVLLVNQIGFSVQAEEIKVEVCHCDIRCSADSVNETCPICVEDYGKCKGVEVGTGAGTDGEPEDPSAGEGIDTGTDMETVPDTGTGEEPGDPGADEGIDTGTDAETVPDTGTGEETENPDADTDTAIDEETEEPDVGEDEDVKTDADTDVVSEVTPEDEGDALLQDEVAKNVVEENVVSLASVGSTFDDGKLEYRILSDGVEVIGCANGTPASVDLEIPPTVTDINNNQYKVVSIGDSAFSTYNNAKYKTIKSITIPDSVTSIGQKAFWGCSIKSITIPGSVGSLGEYAFASCSSLTNITIPGSIKSIENGTFGSCSSLTSITIGNGVRFIGAQAFSGCSSLTSITIPNSVTSTSTSVFMDCSSLTSVTLSNSLNTILQYTFMGCNSLTSITIPNSVHTIGYSAFKGCSSLTSITIPNSVTSIGYSAFEDCSSLVSIDIPAKVTKIWQDTFRNCTSLINLRIAVSQNNFAISSVGADSFYKCPADRYLTLLTQGGTIELSDDTTPTLAEAVKAYDAADGIDDGMWYGWKLTNAAYLVTINVNKDGSTWSTSGKTFALSSDNGSTFITDLTAVSNGTYTIYETEKKDGTGYVTTGVTVKVEDANADVTLKYYTVTFNIDDKDTADSVFAEQIVIENTKIKEPTEKPTKEGYFFKGWVTSAGGSTTFNFNSGITAKTDIYAKWEKETTEYSVTIKVDKDGSKWSNCPKTFALSSDNGTTFIQDLSAVPSGTYTIYETEKKDGTGYVSTDVIVKVEDVDADVTLKYYTVTFNIDDEDTADSDFAEQIVIENTKIKEPTEKPTKEGYEFKGWVTSASGSTAFNFNSGITAKTDIYAKWEKETTEYSVTIKVDKDGSKWSDCPKTFALSSDNGTTFIKDLSAVPNGTYIIYDTTKAASNNRYVNTGVTVVVDGAPKEVEVKYYTVTFYDGDTRLEDQIVLENSKVRTLSPAPTKDGYTFDGWAASEDGSTVFDFEAPITAKTSIYAKWIEKEIPPATEYSVTINVNKDGSVWSNSVKKFALLSDHSTFITDYTAVQNGVYTIYDITGAANSADYVNTGVTVEVKDAPGQAEVNYYTVTFYNDDTRFREQVVLENLKVSAPTVSPAKDGYTFYRWVTSKDGSTEFNFGNPITTKTDIYASWIRAVEETFTIKASAGSGGSVSPGGEVKVKAGDNQRFTITPEKGYQIASILVDGNEVISGGQTGKQSKAGISNGENNIKYYTFENVTSDHALAASFKAINTGNKKPISGGGKGSGSSGGDNTSGSNSTADSGSSITVVLSDMNVRNDTGNINSDSTAPASSEKEPKTGDASHTEIYATIAMISGVSYIALYFADGKRGMTEEEKKEIIAALVRWAKKGKRVRRYVALAVIFLVLVYYHSIGKRTLVNWKAIYVK